MIYTGLKEEFGMTEKCGNLEARGTDSHNLTLEYAYILL
jgi:hypothetical protein